MGDLNDHPTIKEEVARLDSSEGSAVPDSISMEPIPLDHMVAESRAEHGDNELAAYAVPLKYYFNANSTTNTDEKPPPDKMTTKPNSGSGPIGNSKGDDQTNHSRPEKSDSNQRHS